MKTLWVFFLAILPAFAQNGSFTNISAAGGNGTITPGSVVFALGAGLSDQVAQATDVPLPTTLAGISVQIVDNVGMVRLAGLYSVSPVMINYVVPAGTAPGSATVQIFSGSNMTVSGAIQVQPQTAAPVLFSANGDGQGVAAATAYARAIPTPLQFPVTVFQCGSDPGSCVSVPVDPGIDRPVTLNFYGTGIRGASNVSLTIGGMDVPVIYAGPHRTIPGLDEVDVPLLLDLRGMGEVDVVLTADGQASNPVRINIQ